MLILILNAGSTSMKFKLYDMSAGARVLAQGNCQRVGLKDSEIKFIGPSGEKHELLMDLADHQQAMDLTLRLLSQGDTAVIDGVEKLDAIGHRVAVGGPKMVKSALIDGYVVAEIEKYAQAAPLHTPLQVATIRACRKLLGDGFPMVAGFDTAFHQTMPKEVYFCPIPYEFYEDYGMRRMGYHGLSHQYIVERYAELTGENLQGTRIVSCHLGGGSSLSAVKDGKSMDNTLGFGTGEGLMCGTRAGTFDHSAIAHLIEVTGKDFCEIEEILQRRSGLLGVSGISSDAKELEDHAAKGNERARLALDMLSVQIKKYIGAYAFLMGGLDTVLFAGGIGENSVHMRESVCEGLEGLGIRLDKQLNAALNRREGRISAEGSPVELWVIPTNEELVIARDTLDIVRALKKCYNGNS